MDKQAEDLDQPQAQRDRELQEQRYWEQQAHETKKLDRDRRHLILEEMNRKDQEEMDRKIRADRDRELQIRKYWERVAQKDSEDWVRRQFQHLRMLVPEDPDQPYVQRDMERLIERGMEQLVVREPTIMPVRLLPESVGVDQPVQIRYREEQPKFMPDLTVLDETVWLAAEQRRTLAARAEAFVHVKPDVLD